MAVDQLINKDSTLRMVDADLNAARVVMGEPSILHAINVIAMLMKHRH